MDNAKKIIDIITLFEQIKKDVQNAEVDSVIKKRIARKQLLLLEEVLGVNVDKFDEVAPAFNLEKYEYLSKLKSMLQTLINKYSLRPLNGRTHLPIVTSNFLNLFRVHSDLRFVTHDWDDGKPYDNLDFIEKCLKALIDFLKEESLDKSMRIEYVRYDLLNFIFAFLFRENTKWSYQNIRLGYSSREIIEWQQKEENIGKHISGYSISSDCQVYKVRGKEYQYQYFSDLINKFKKEIRFIDENSHFVVNLKQRYRRAGLVGEFNPNYDPSLNGLELSVAVGRFNEGVDRLLNPIAKRIGDTATEIFFFSEKKDNYIDFKIHHKGSKSSRSKEEVRLLFKKGGDFKTAYEKFFGLCDWYLDADTTDGMYHFKYLDSGCVFNEVFPVQKSEVEDGWMHTLRFYKPNIYD